MNKKFIPLTNPAAPGTNPYRIITWQFPDFHRETILPESAQTPHGKKSKTRLSRGIPVNLFKKNIATPLQGRRQHLHKTCAASDSYRECVHLVHSPREIINHSLVREKIIAIREQLEPQNYVNIRKKSPNKYDLIKFASPTDIGQVKLASPSPSSDAVYLPSRKLLDIKKPHSGVFINETPNPFAGESELPPNYNPRDLQYKLENEYNSFEVREKNGQRFVQPTGQTEITRMQNCCCHVYSSQSPLTDFKGTSEKDKFLHLNVVIEQNVTKKSTDIEYPYPGVSELELRMKKASKIIDETENIPSCGAADMTMLIFAEFRLERMPLDKVTRQPKEVALLYAVYACNFVYNIQNWTMSTMAQIQKLGDELYEKSLNTRYENDSDFDIEQHLTIGRTPLTISCSSPLFVGLLDDECKNALNALGDYFHDRWACIFTCGNEFILIWKYCTDYIVFDPHGRTREDLKPDEKLGYASLTSHSSLQCFMQIFRQGSDCLSHLPFKLYEIGVRSYGIPHDIIHKVSDVKPKRHFTRVNAYTVIIRSGDGLIIPAKSKMNPSMYISCLARIYSDIDPARFWTRNVIDQLVKYAIALFTKQVKTEKLKTYTIANLPKAYRLGSYRSEIQVTPFVASGQVGKCSSFRESQLAAAICFIFEKYDTALLQIDSCTIAIWKDSKFYYIFDPFRRSQNGTPVTGEERGAACLIICLNLRTACSTLFTNAQATATEGNFFIHAIEIIKTRIAHHSKLKTEMETFPLLLLDYPANCDITRKFTKLGDEKTTEDIPKNVIDRCLSRLSVTPCERTCSELDILEMERETKARLRKMGKIKARLTESSTSLTASQKVPWYDAYDVVEPILESMLNVCFNSVQPRLEKVSKAGKVRKVLLKSDKTYLQGLVRSVMRGDDYDNFFAEHPSTPNMQEYVTVLEDELKVDTPFELMPDGCWIVSSTDWVDIPDTDVNLGSLSAFVATILAGKYNVKFWNSKLLDYIMQTAQILQNSTQLPHNMISFLLDERIPRIEIERDVYTVTVEQLGTGPASTMSDILENAFEKQNNLIVILNTFSCAVFKRNVFYFLFMGYPSDVVGFRCSSTGRSCLVRSLDLDSIIRRIHANRMNHSDAQNMIVFGVLTKDMNESRFISRSPSEEELAYSRARDAEQIKKERAEMKILFLEDELTKEQQRIDNFKKSKWEHMEEYSDMMEEEEFIYNENEEEPLPQPKHLPGAIFPPTGRRVSEIGEHIRRRPELGYRYYEPDHNFKIQGTTALSDRDVPAGTQVIRTCYFASLYAIMFAIHRPLPKWDFRRVDMAIENGIQLGNLVQDKNVADCRIVNNFIIDKSTYKLEIKKYEIYQSTKRHPVRTAIQKIIGSRKYFLLQFENTTFGVHKEEYFHLFDPYKTLHVINQMKSAHEPARLKTMKPLPDRDTASWIIFPNVDYMLAYIQKRMTSRNWESEFNLYVINILLMKKAPKKERIARLLQDSPIDNEEVEADYQFKEMQNEQVAWIEMFGGSVPWSPLLQFNLDNEKRGLTHTKWKSYDVELSGKLYSLWGHIHPNSGTFGANSGKQYQAINVIACCMASIYHVEEWTPSILNSIVVYGDRYFTESISEITYRDYELTLEDMNTEFSMSTLCDFIIHLESVVYGSLYEVKPKIFNLSRALAYFFISYRYGIIQCFRKTLAFGKTKTGYFLFDCQSQGKPLFEADQGCAYVLFASTIETLLYCMAVTLRVPYYNIEFVIYAIAPRIKESQDTNEGEVGTLPQPISPGQPGMQTTPAAESAPEPAMESAGETPLDESGPGTI